MTPSYPQSQVEYLTRQYGLPAKSPRTPPDFADRWVRCTVFLPDSSAEGFSCLAKVSCADLIDALELDPWAAQAFVHLWDSGSRNVGARRRAIYLANALYCLERATTGLEARWSPSSD